MGAVALGGALLMLPFGASAELIHRWGFNEGSGTTLSDSVGNADGQIVVANVPDYIRGSNYVRLPGGGWSTADYMQMPSGLISGLTNVTIEVWATPNAAQNWSRIFDFGSATGGNAANAANDFYLSFCRGTSLNVQRMEHDPAPQWRIDTSVPTTTSNQYHYVATWSRTGGAGGGGRAAWYRDGVLIGSTNTGSRYVANVDDTVLWLGRSHFTADNTASADFNEVRIYDHAMSASEVYSSGLSGPDTVVTPPTQASGIMVATNAFAGSLTISWTPGTGSSGSIVVMSAGLPPSNQLTNGNTYPASATFGSGFDLGGGSYVVYSSSGSSVAVTNLDPGVYYHAAVYSYTGDGSSRIYNLGDAPEGSGVYFETATSIQLELLSSLLLTGAGQASVLADFGGGPLADVTAFSSFQSLSPAVVTVDALGRLQALDVGSAQITATFQGLSATNLVMVTDPRIENLTHRYPFIADASDVIGAAHGSLQGGAVVENDQLVLNGSTAYADLPDGILAGYESFTIEAWVSNSLTETWSRIFDFGNNTTVNMFLTPRADNSGGPIRFAITVGGGGGAEQRANGTAALPLNAPTQVAVTLAGNLAVLYVNGQPVGSNTTMTLSPADLGSTAENYLGRSQYPADPFYDGTIDEFRIYNVALPPALLLTNYLDGPDGITLAPPTVVNDEITINPGASALIPVLANDTGPAADPSSLEIVNSPAHGTAEVKAGGRVLYVHDGSANPTDLFTYRVQGVLGSISEVATVSITVTNTLRLAAPTIAMPDAPPPVTYTIEDAFPGLFFEDALAIATPPGRTNQIFVAERRGRISYIPDIHAATPQRQVFLDISSQVSFDDTSQGERGLLGLAFHPDFESNGYFYVFYVAPGSPYTNRLARFQADPMTLTVNTNTQQPFFDVLDQQFNHNGGDLHFGPDGFLYISTGDEGNQYNAQQNAQRIDKDLFSALLRIDVDRLSGVEPRPSANTTHIYTDGLGQAYYSIPADNPFVNATNFNGSITNVYGGLFNTNTLRAEIFATGLRHVWRFSIDAPTGDIWVGDVGQDRWEEINLVTNGGNYGWGFYEGTHLARELYPAQVNLFTNPPPGLSPPLYEYFHAGQGGGNPSYEGDSVTGGVVYRGSNMPELYGAYLFADFEFQHLWALRRNGTNVSVERLADKLGIAAFGVDPSNGDILLANYLDNQIQRLVRSDAGGGTFPQTLTETGVFADLAALTPNPGVVGYEPKVAFWSDNALKTRWFSLPDLASKVSFAQDTNWTLPSGMVWIKHFDLELERGNSATRKRIETRILKKTDTGSYGVSYKWNDAGSEAYLVADQGDLFVLTVTNQGMPTLQTYEIPSRAGCLACHTAGGGHALTFNTREMNHEGSLNGVAGNQIDTLAAAGYFSAPVPPSGLLPIHAAAADTNASLEFRVRSYLAVNCSQCHRANGTGGGAWDGRAHLTLDQTGLINGLLDNTGGNPTNRLIVPGDKDHSVVWLRIQGTNGFGRMPPLGSHVLDQMAISLMAAWIDTDLTNRVSFADWQIANFGSTIDPNAQATADPDNDGANNHYEWLTQTPPLTNAPPPWTISIDKDAGTISVNFKRVANVGFVVETGDTFGNWAPWNVPENQLWFSASTFEDSVSGPHDAAETNRFFRVRIVEP